MRNTKSNSMADHLKAANLFGYQEQASKQEPTLVATPPQNPNVINAVYPAIIDTAFAQTMDNYRVHIATYNFRTEAENELINKHNSAVKLYILNNPLSELEKEYVGFFMKRYNNLTAREYNTEVDNACKAHGMIVAKRKIQKVKYATEQVFQNFLSLYNSQLMKRNSEYMRLGVRTPRPIQEMDINAYLVTKMKRKEVTSLDVCSKTVRNHRKRLQEAGVFSEFIFCGSTRGVKVQINPEILTVLDLQTNKLTVAENQLVTSGSEKVLPDNNGTTRTFKEQYKNRNDATQSFDDKEFPAVTSSLHYKNNFYKNTGSKLKNSPEGAPAETSKKEKTLSEKLRDIILHPQELAERLAQGLFNNYVPIDVRLLYKEAYNGTLTSTEFQHLIIQDCFCNAAKLYRDATPYTGSWKNAINCWLQNKFMNYKGIVFNKTNIVDDVQQLRWRLEHARRWFSRTGIKPLYPSNYFDITRKTSKEIGFEFTRKAWERHVKYMENQPAKKRKLERNAEARLKTINHAKKFENEIKRFLRNKITLPQLYDYVRRNLPAEFYSKLPETIDKMMSNTKL